MNPIQCMNHWKYSLKAFENWKNLDITEFETQPQLKLDRIFIDI
ncbi:2433_t:CDS:2 [Diversispora eburnea]|uniref:2433_t:CDS:1 n=1 Tax=Diversispora eburnea TaxID=1213867 RepID=A0A9N8W0E3_9GLOM|nr:2433_t:CDS:2 [Diversispora eburnea]